MEDEEGLDSLYTSSQSTMISGESNCDTNDDVDKYTPNNSAPSTQARLLNGIKITEDQNQISKVNLSGKSLLKLEKEVHGRGSNFSGNSVINNQQNFPHSNSQATIEQGHNEVTSHYDSHDMRRESHGGDNEASRLVDSMQDFDEADYHRTCEPCEDGAGIDIGFSSDQTAQWIKHIIETQEEDVQSTEEDKNDFYSCHVCNLVLPTIISLEHHIKMQHTGERGDFMLEKSNDINLQQTDTLELGESSFVCDTNGETFRQDHLKIKSKRPKPFKCSECNKSFSWRKELHTHARIHSLDKPLKCNECSESFIRGRDLKMHMRTHTGEKLFTCSQCNQSFNTKWNLSTHMRIHSGEKPYSCNECSQSFNTKWNLRIHVERRHSGEMPYQCNECHQSFSRKRDFLVHMTEHRGGKPFRCSECDKSFNSNGNLVIHMRTHTGERPFCCSECGKSFNHVGHLQSHLRTHTGEMPYSCSECGKCFSDQGNLQRHMRTHTGETPFSCSQCGKCFRDLSNLNRHMITHTGEKPFKCSECGQSFNTKWNLITHMRTHSGEKPFICNECSHSFYTKGNLLIHIQRRHSTKKQYQDQNEACSQGPVS